MLSQVDESTQRNPIHLSCFNKYQKCIPTLELLFAEIMNPDIVMNNKFLADYNTVEALLNQNIDPRNYSETLFCLSQALLP